MSDPTIFSALVEMSNEGLIALSRDGEVMSCNAAASSVFGFPHAGAVGRPFEALLDPNPSSPADHRQRVTSALDQARTNGTSTFQLELRRGDGSLHALEVSLLSVATG